MKKPRTGRERQPDPYRLHPEALLRKLTGQPAKEEAHA
jgi:hypothetical protein